MVAAGVTRPQLAAQVELMHAIVENGPWVLIPDPDLRVLASRHVADAVAGLAAEIGADDAQAAAERSRGPGSPPLRLPVRDG